MNRNASKLASIVSLYKWRNTGGPEWEKACEKEMADACEKGGLLEQVLVEHEAMRSFICREMNTADDYAGYSDSGMSAKQLFTEKWF